MSGGMEHLIPIINQLQNVFTAVGSAPISLPQLVVVGSQSSGKSSVLEHIVGRDFLPRGTGIVTRRPLILQLVHTGSAFDDEEDDEQQAREGGARKDSGAAAAAAVSPSAASRAAASPAAGAARRSAVDDMQEWGEFLHLPGKKFHDFNAIRAEIVAETDRVTGGSTGKAVSAHPINLRIFSPHVLNLTLVDLPGLTKLAVADQPADIEAQIASMILSFISSPHAIIIAVSPANADLANSDSLKIAREVDPSGIRTIGVLTKIDLMDRGTDAMQVLIGNSPIELQHGFVGVVCRSQEAIQQGKPIRDALLAEKTYFAQHPVYRSLASRLGTPYLARRLNALLMHHIQSSLPDIRSKISSTIAETSAELESYGSAHVHNEEKGSLLLPLLSSYCAHLSDALDGRSPEVLNELYGGARISYIFRELFACTLDALDPLDLLSDHDIRTSIRNASGPRPSLFLPELAFELLVRKQIERLLAPAIDCVDLVFHELQRVASQCEALSPELARFPELRARLLQVCARLMSACVEPTKAHIERCIQCELSFINTSHPDFIGGSHAVAIVMARMEAKGRKGGGAAAAATNASTSAAAREGEGSSSEQSGAASALSKQTSGAATTHGRSSSVAPPPAPTQRHPAPAQTQGGSSWGFPALFGRSPSPSASRSGSTAAGTAAHQPGSREGERKRAVADGLHEHELYSNSKHAAAHSHAAAASSSSASAAALSSSSPPSSWALKSSAPTDRELIETEVIKLLMQSYFSVVRKSVTDLVPKAIMAFLVQRVKRELQAELVRELYQPHLLDQLMREADDIAEKRESCKELLAILQRAMDILNSARDFNAMATLA